MINSTETATVYIVDDEPSMLEVVPALLDELNLDVQTFRNGGELLEHSDFAHIGCILLDNIMPGQTGLETQAALHSRGIYLPCIFMSGQSGFEDVVQAVQSGAEGFLQKPFGKETLQDAVQKAIKKSRALLQRSNDAIEYRAKVASLTKRENDVFNMMRRGYSTKRSAEELDITPSTVEFHRTNVLKKTGFASISEVLAFELKLKSEVCTCGD